MIAGTASSDPISAVRLTPREVLSAWRGITGTELWATFLLGAALCAYHVGTGLALGGGGVARIAPTLVADEIRAFALLLAVVVADRVIGKDPGRRSAYAWAVVVAAAVATPVSIAARTVLVNAFVSPAEPDIPTVPVALYILLDFVLIGGAAVWVILDRRRASAAQARMHTAELDRIAAEKRSIESDLQAMQARVEPQFLFNTLAQVKQLYTADPAPGERMLEELIAYLRAAMPTMRDTTSTVEQEVALVRAYLAIVEVRLGERLKSSIDAPDDLGPMRMPPMMLLPLIAHALERSEHASCTVTITSHIVDGRLRIAIGVDSDAFQPHDRGEAITGVVERLAALFERDATLLLHGRASGKSEAVIELPIEVETSPA